MELPQNEIVDLLEQLPHQILSEFKFFSRTFKLNFLLTTGGVVLLQVVLDHLLADSAFRVRDCLLECGGALLLVVILSAVYLSILVHVVVPRVRRLLSIGRLSVVLKMRGVS